MMSGYSVGDVCYGRTRTLSQTEVFRGKGKETSTQRGGVILEDGGKRQSRRKTKLPGSAGV